MRLPNSFMRRHKPPIRGSLNKLNCARKTDKHVERNGTRRAEFISFEKQLATQMEHLLHDTKIHLCDNFTQWLIEDFRLIIDIFLISLFAERWIRVKALTREREIAEEAREATTKRFFFFLMLFMENSKWCKFNRSEWIRFSEADEVKEPREDFAFSGFSASSRWRELFNASARHARSLWYWQSSFYWH